MDPKEINNQPTALDKTAEETNPPVAPEVTPVVENKEIPTVEAPNVETPAAPVAPVTPATAFPTSPPPPAVAPVTLAAAPGEGVLGPAITGLVLGGIGAALCWISFLPIMALILITVSAIPFVISIIAAIYNSKLFAKIIKEKQPWKIGKIFVLIAFCVALVGAILNIIFMSIHLPNLIPAIACEKQADGIAAYYNESSNSNIYTKSEINIMKQDCRTNSFARERAKTLYDSINERKTETSEVGTPNSSASSSSTATTTTTSSSSEIATCKKDLDKLFNATIEVVKEYGVSPTSEEITTIKAEWDAKMDKYCSTADGRSEIAASATNIAQYKEALRKELNGETSGTASKWLQAAGNIEW